MDAFLKKLRAKSDGSKRRIVLFSSLGITLVILAGYLVSIKVTATLAPSETASVADTTGTSPFDTLAAGLSAIGTSFGLIKTEVQGLFASTTK